MSGLKVGDPVALVSLRMKRIIYDRYVIERETPKFWIVGSHRYRKSDGRRAPDYIDEHRAILPLAKVPADFARGS